MLSVQDARNRILLLAPSLGAEDAPVDEAIGRALAEDVRALRTLPPWNNSAMDGYALRAEDVRQVPVRLAVVERIFAGAMPQRRIGPMECARIMTGAPMPEGADAVVIQEKTAARGDEVEILASAAPGANVRDRGEDAVAGERLLAKGTSLGIPEAALLWGQGLTRARVPRRPRVGILSTGDELCRVDEEPNGRIVDTNSPSLAVAVRRAGGVPIMLGIARDEPAAVQALLAKALELDVAITSAGVSVGEKDFVRDALAALGVQMDFWKVAIKPGKPLAVGRRADTLVFGLPGNPTSSLVSFELFVRPALRRMLGHADVEPARVSGVSEVELKKAAGIEHYVRVTVQAREGKLWARPLASQTSGAVRSAASATHLLVLPAESTGVRPGEAVDLLPVSWTCG